MKRWLPILFAAFLLLTTTACAKKDSMPNPQEDYIAFYQYLQQQQAEGEIAFEDKLAAEGFVDAPFSLIIDGKIFDNEVASALTVYTATFEQYSKVEPHTYAWVGYRFTDVCELLEIALENSIKLHAADGFNQVFDVKNIDGNTMIAITKDGDPSDGPFFAPCTYLITANYTKYLNEITVP